MVATVELMACARAIRAMIDMAAAPGRAATEHSFHGAPVIREDGTPGLCDIRGPVLAKQIRELHSKPELVVGKNRCRLVQHVVD
jgi:hypothetical protein